MADFGLITVSEEKEGDFTKRKILKHFSCRIKKLFKRQKPEDRIKKIPLYDNVNVHLITLPCDTSSLEQFIASGRAERYVSAFSAESGISCCLWSGQIWGGHAGAAAFRNSFTGGYLYKALLPAILDKIYTKLGVKIRELDIAVVSGENPEELHSVLVAFLPEVKYLTVLTDRKDETESNVSSVYADTGLSIRLTGDYKSGLKNADLIINLGGLRGHVLNSAVVNPRALILNYGELDPSRILSENILINSLDIELPEEITFKIGVDISRHFKSLELAEAILSHKLGEEYRVASCTADYRLMESLAGEFKKEGFKIRGFTGRRNLLTTNDIYAALKPSLSVKACGS